LFTKPWQVLELDDHTVIARCHYFKSMLASSFIGKEADENTVVMDSEVDHEDAFNMFVEFLYTTSYSLPDGYDTSAKATLHV
jgi:BTB/POZ domain